MTNVEVNELFAWVAKDGEGEEGIIGMPTARGVLPLVMVRQENAEKFKVAAVAAAMARGQTAYLKRFVLTDVLDTIIPPTAN